MAKLSSAARSHRMSIEHQTAPTRVLGQFFALNTDSNDKDGDFINCTSEHHAVCAAIAANKKCGSYDKWVPCVMTKAGFHMMDIFPKPMRDRQYA